MAAAKQQEGWHAKVHSSQQTIAAEPLHENDAAKAAIEKRESI